MRDEQGRGNSINSSNSSNISNSSNSSLRKFAWATSVSPGDAPVNPASNRDRASLSNRVNSLRLKSMFFI